MNVKKLSITAHTGYFIFSLSFKRFDSDCPEVTSEKPLFHPLEKNGGQMSSQQELLCCSRRGRSAELSYQPPRTAAEAERAECQSWLYYLLRPWASWVSSLSLSFLILKLEQRDNLTLPTGVKMKGGVIWKCLAHSWCLESGQKVPFLPLNLNATTILHHPSLAMAEYSCLLIILWPWVTPPLHWGCRWVCVCLLNAHAHVCALTWPLLYMCDLHLILPAFL